MVKKMIELKRKLSMTCPLPIKIPKKVVNTEKTSDKFVMMMLKIESVTSLMTPIFAFTHAIILE